MSEHIAVVGMWHLGCSIAASWLRLGHDVTAIDFNSNSSVILDGRAPIVEPGVDAEFSKGFQNGKFKTSDNALSISGCSFVFITYDTPVDDEDVSDTSPIHEAIEKCGPYIDQNSIVIISSQLPVGEARELRDKLKILAPSTELVYSPENLRLGEAINCYLQPGHIVIGSEVDDAASRVEKLFEPMKAEIFKMNLPSAEMTKHCINSFLATSVTLANQWSDIAVAYGANYNEIQKVLRKDPRFGSKAYITPGIGFSGGTLGRDLKALDARNREGVESEAPIFGQVWRYNSERVWLIAYRIAYELDEFCDLRGKRIGLLGMTYKPGTSTLRRSMPLKFAEAILSYDADVVAHDPMANWEEVKLPSGLSIVKTPYEVAANADAIVLLTEWPEYRELDFRKIASLMKEQVIFDTKDFLGGVVSGFFNYVVLGKDI